MSGPRWFRYLLVWLAALSSLALRIVARAEFRGFTLKQLGAAGLGLAGLVGWSWWRGRQGPKAQTSDDIAAAVAEYCRHTGAIPDGPYAAHTNVGVWTLTFEAPQDQSYRYGRVRALYVRRRRLLLEAYLTSSFDRVHRLVGGQDVVVSHPSFDEFFTVKATDPELARRVLNPLLQEKLIAKPDLVLEIDHPPIWVVNPTGIRLGMVLVHTDQGRCDLDTLMFLHETTTQLLEALVAAEAATTEDPQRRLWVDP